MLVSHWLVFSAEHYCVAATAANFTICGLPEYNQIYFLKFSKK